MGGFGYANREHKEPVQPDSLFRIASISKSFTAWPRCS
jgi:CubicO group peptidase (beta-lactamase class C family)